MALIGDEMEESKAGRLPAPPLCEVAVGPAGGGGGPLSPDSRKHAPSSSWAPEGGN